MVNLRHFVIHVVWKAIKTSRVVRFFCFTPEHCLICLLFAILFPPNNLNFSYSLDAWQRKLGKPLCSSRHSVCLWSIRFKMVNSEHTRPVDFYNRLPPFILFGWNSTGSTLQSSLESYRKIQRLMRCIIRSVFRKHEWAHALEK